MMRIWNPAMLASGLVLAVLVVPSAALAQQSSAPAPAVSTSAAPAATPAEPPAVSRAEAPAEAPVEAPAEASKPIKTVSRADAKAGKSSDRIELDTTDITGNRELPKVMYIVPWKHSDLGDLTGKPMNSLVDEVLQPVDRDVFRRENRYYGAVSGAGSTTESAPASAAAHSAPHGPGDVQASAPRDER